MAQGAAVAQPSDRRWGFNRIFRVTIKNVRARTYTRRALQGRRERTDRVPARRRVLVSTWRVRKVRRKVQKTI
jgi:hypothetical protein